MKRQLLLIALFFLTKISYSQTTGDYRSKASANSWADVSSWEIYNGVDWVNATAIPTTSLTLKPSKITIVAPTTVGAILYMNTYSGDLTTTDLYINDGVTFQIGYDQSFSCYLSVKSLIINAGGIFRVPTTNLITAHQALNDSNNGVRTHSFYTQNNLIVSNSNGIINPNPAKFIGIYTFSYTPDANGTLNSYTQKLVGYLGNGTHPPASANVIYPPVGGTPAWNMYGTVLPVKLTSYEVSNYYDKQVNITWQTATEINNDYFTISKSRDGKIFETVSTIKSKGNSGNYKLIDYSPFNRTSYYKLSQTDKDGKKEELDIKAITLMTLKEQNLQVYPNPIVNGIINIQKTDLEGSQNLVFYDLSGKVVLQDDINFRNGVANYTIKNNLPKGTYILNMADLKMSSRIMIE